MAAAPTRIYHQKKLDTETVAMALDWVRGELTTPEVRGRFNGLSTNLVVYRMGSALRQAYREGRLQIIAAP